jgi:hypothetical protein
MRRGAALNEVSKKRQPVVADLHDLEGGDVSSPSGKPIPYMRATSGDSFSAASGSGSLDLDSGVSPSAKDKKKRVKHIGVNYTHYLTKTSPKKLQLYAVALIAATACLCPFLSIQWCILTLVFSSCCFGTIASLWLSRSVLSCDDGTPEMRAVSDPIREGAEGFLRVQYSAIAKFAIPLAGLIVLSYQFRPESDESTGVAKLGNKLLGLVAAFGFVAGAVCSAVSGYTSMWVAAKSNIRVASAARRSYGETLVVCFRGGAFSAVLNLTLCIAGKYFVVNGLDSFRVKHVYRI